MLANNYFKELLLMSISNSQLFSLTALEVMTHGEKGGNLNWLIIRSKGTLMAGTVG